MEATLRDDPEHVEALEVLGHLYTQDGRHRQGLEVDRRLARLRPEEPLVHYNLACSLALCGDPDGALKALKRSMALGYRDLEHMARDPDLATLRDLPEFRRLLEGRKEA
ncbi:MAG: hypothetical protein HY722_02195 [Planctomycetes bacterium]|nr:hypothetical protein [Planctomycetota bacterium]